MYNKNVNDRRYQMKKSTTKLGTQIMGGFTVGMGYLLLSLLLMLQLLLYVFWGLTLVLLTSVTTLNKLALWSTKLTPRPVSKVQQWIYTTRHCETGSQPFEGEPTPDDDEWFSSSEFGMDISLLPKGEHDGRNEKA
jgi:hypothetical protein